jgi:hypothetical protein
VCFLDWFLKSLVPYVSKDVTTSKLFYEEEAIMRARKLELIYSQSSMLYDILPDAPQSTFDLNKLNFGSHVDGIVGSTQSKPTYQLSNQMQ